MPLRPLACAGLLLLTAAGSAPDTLRYRVTVKGTAAGMRVQRTGGGDAEATPDSRPLGVRALVTLALADSAGGRRVRAALDSLADGRQAQAANEPQGPDVRIVRPDDGLPATGAAWSAHLDAAGRVAAFRMESRSRGSRVLDDVVPLLLPRVRAPLAKGAAWTDTTEFATPTPEGSQRQRVTTSYRVTGEERVGGAKAWRVEAALVGAGEAKATVQGEEITRASATTGSGVYRLAADGRLLDGRLVREHRVTFTAGGLPAPVSGTAADTVTIAPAD